MLATFYNISSEDFRSLDAKLQPVYDTVQKIYGINFRMIAQNGHIARQKPVSLCLGANKATSDKEIMAGLMIGCEIHNQFSENQKTTAPAFLISFDDEGVSSALCSSDGFLVNFQGECSTISAEEFKSNPGIVAQHLRS